MTTTLDAVSRETLGADAWNRAVESSDDGWLWHRYELQDALATWRGRTDCGFALIDQTRPELVEAIVPAQRVRNWLGSVTLESFGGPALRQGGGHRHRARLMEVAREQLAALAAEGGASSVTVALPPLAPALRGERCPRVNPLLDAGFENAVTQTWMVDLDGGPDAIWRRMEGRARTAVRKAEKAGISVRVADRPDDVNLYYRLHRETYRRTGAKPHPRAYFERVWCDFLATGLARIWVAEMDGQPVAAENFATYKGAAWYWTGAATARGLAVEANSLLQWEAMLWMAAAGMRWYDTGEAFPEARSGKLKGLNDFKRSFGGVLYPVFRGVLRGGGLRGRITRAIGALVR
jgi:hypothetical protein